MKILVIRFSSIGDIVLTTPVVRCLKKQIPDAEIHFLTKISFVSLVENNPYVSKIYSIKDKVAEVGEALKKEKYDFVIDLHHNLRSAQVKRAAGTKAFSFNKLNIGKWLLVNFKINKLPNIHIVDRYFETVKTLGVVNDNAGLDFFIPEKDLVDIVVAFKLNANNYHALVVGGSYYTKQIPINKLQEICRLSDRPIIVLGGKEDIVTGLQLEKEFTGKVFSACGKFNINQSASIVQQADKIITSDTGLMHIAAAFKKDVFSLWGNTIPEFGMYPYLPGKGSKILEVKNLSCRPCSKLGYSKCPKGHFKCMNEINVKEIF
ncbi:MAG TPA: glycosyltransferase family 9 protein [Bacteroidia bacterium]|nr:glycosyltransferase family 9 protein [Bacteroidia bacterium]